MNTIKDILPKIIKKEDIALAPANWSNALSRYSQYRRKALTEATPGYNTFMAMLLFALVKCDKNLIEKAIGIVGENIPRYVILSLAGCVYCDLGVPDQGLPMQREAASLNPLPSLLLSLAADTDNLDEAEELIQRVLKEDTQNSDALRQLAFVKHARGDTEEALQILNNILLKEPNNKLVLEHKGNMLLDIKEYSKALAVYKKIKIKPKPISLEYRICLCYYRIGKYFKAKSIAKRIKNKVALDLELKPQIDNVNQMLDEIMKCKIGWRNWLCFFSE